MLRALVLLALTTTASAQWTLQNSGTTASLRGIHSLGNGVAWASGTNGTVLRTQDGGKHWQHCTTPPNADKLDFRGIQAFDANAALVMSSGTGDLSRIYKTTDGCQTWRLVLKNPDAQGFFDGLAFEANVWGTAPGLSQENPKVHTGFIMGDPVDGKFVLFETRDTGETWKKWTNDDHMRPATALTKEGAFAASNTSLISPGFHRDFAFITGGPTGSRLMIEQEHMISDRKMWLGFQSVQLPLAPGESAGAFSLAARYRPAPAYSVDFMIVGGDYKQPDKTDGNAVFVTRTDQRTPVVRKPETPPHGYRSAVAYDASTKSWITVGPSGTDVSTDDGRNWTALKPGAGDASDADKNWNALSLPFVVGSKGRIGVLSPDVLKHAH